MDPIEKYLKSCKTIISRYGWMIQGVEDTLPWNYTVGLTAVGRLELCIAGLPHQLSKEILNTAVPLHNVENFASGDMVNLGYPFEFLVTEILATNMNVVKALYPDTFRHTVLQLVWPDEDGNYHLEKQVIPVD